MIYFDNAATMKPSEDAKFRFSIYQNYHWGNPHSINPSEIDSSDTLSIFRKLFAYFMGCEQKNIFCTSCASESNAQIIKTALAYGVKCKKNHIVTTAIEHPSILLYMKHLESLGYEVSYAMPNKNGNVPVEHVTSLIRDDTFFVSVMLVNNETGAIQDVETIAKYCRDRKILFHTDATQGACMPEISCLKNSCIDFVSLSGHKIGAGTGAGLLYMSEEARRLVGSSSPFPLIFGHQQKGARGGTINAPAITAFTKEYTSLRATIGEKIDQIAKLEEALLAKMSEKVKFKLNCDVYRKPGILSVCFENLPADHLVSFCRAHDISISAGSACHTGSPEPSYVLKSMGLSDDEVRRTVRISLGWENTLCEIDKFIGVLCKFDELYSKHL
jgi:cysteine desulfurase